MNLKKTEWCGDMSKLTDYIGKVKEYIVKNPDLSELEIVRYVYLDLGKMFKFNLDFFFGNSKTKRHIYRESGTAEGVNQSMNSQIIICKSLSNIFERIMNELGIDATTVIDPDDEKLCPHVYNIVGLKDGRRFSVDLQSDLGNIQSHAVTKHFGLSTLFDDKNLVISRYELEQIDRKLGYIDNENYYSDDYLYLLKSDIGSFESFPEKARFVLENVDIYENKDMGYFERKMKHEAMLRDLFTPLEMRRVHLIDCYSENKRSKGI